MYIRLLVKCPLLLSDSNGTWIFCIVFPEILKYENQYSTSQVVPCGRTVKQMKMTKIRVAVLSFANAPKRCEQIVGTVITASTDFFFVRFSDFAQGMILTGTTRSNGVETCHRATLSTRSLIVTKGRYLKAVLLLGSQHNALI